MAILKYSLLRLAAFFIIFAAFLLLELGMLFALIAGLVASWAVAYLGFNRLRLEAGAQLARRVSARKKRSAAEQEDNAAEDALAEEFHSQDEPQGAQDEGWSAQHEVHAAPEDEDTDPRP